MQPKHLPYLSLYVVISMSMHISANAQLHFATKWEKSKMITNDHGLSAANVLTMAEDDYGRIWIGTQYGVDMLDGTGWLKPVPQPDGHLTEGGNFRYIATGSRNNIFFANSNSLFRLSYDPTAAGNPLELKAEPKLDSLNSDSDSISGIEIKTNTLAESDTLFVSKGKKVYCYLIENGDINLIYKKEISENIISIELGEGCLIACSANAIYHKQIHKSEEFVQIKRIGKDSVYKVHHISQDRFAVLYKDHIELVQFSSTPAATTTLRMPKGLEKPKASYIQHQGGDTYFLYYILGNDTLGYALYQQELSAGSSAKLLHKNTRYKNARDIFIDSHGGFWVSIYAVGLQYTFEKEEINSYQLISDSPGISVAPDNTVWSVLYDKGALYIGYSEGLYYYPHKGGGSEAPNRIYDGQVNAIIKHPNTDTIYAGTTSGVILRIVQGKLLDSISTGIKSPISSLIYKDKQLFITYIYSGLVKMSLPKPSGKNQTISGPKTYSKNTLSQSISKYSSLLLLGTKDSLILYNNTTTMTQSDGRKAGRISPISRIDDENFYAWSDSLGIITIRIDGEKKINIIGSIPTSFRVFGILPVGGDTFLLSTSQGIKIWIKGRNDNDMLTLDPRHGAQGIDYNNGAFFSNDSLLIVGGVSGFDIIYKHDVSTLYKWATHNDPTKWEIRSVWIKSGRRKTDDRVKFMYGKEIYKILYDPSFFPPYENLSFEIIDNNFTTPMLTLSSGLRLLSDSSHVYLRDILPKSAEYTYQLPISHPWLSPGEVFFVTGKSLSDLKNIKAFISITGRYYIQLSLLIILFTVLAILSILALRSIISAQKKKKELQRREIELNKNILNPAIEIIGEMAPNKLPSFIHAIGKASKFGNYLFGFGVIDEYGHLHFTYWKILDGEVLSLNYPIEILAENQLANFFSEYVINHKKSISIKDAQNKEEYSKYLKEERKIKPSEGDKSRSMAFAPLIKAGKVFGVITFQDENPRMYDQSTLEFIDYIAKTISESSYNPAYVRSPYLYFVDRIKIEGNEDGLDNFHLDEEFFHGFPTHFNRLFNFWGFENNYKELLSLFYSENNPKKIPDNHLLNEAFKGYGNKRITPLWITFIVIGAYTRIEDNKSPEEKAKLITRILGVFNKNYDENYDEISSYKKFSRTVSIYIANENEENGTRDSVDSLIFKLFYTLMRDKKSKPKSTNVEGDNFLTLDIKNKTVKVSLLFKREKDAINIESCYSLKYMDDGNVATTIRRLREKLDENVFGCTRSNNQITFTFAVINP